VMVGVYIHNTLLTHMHARMCTHAYRYIHKGNLSLLTYFLCTSVCTNIHSFALWPSDKAVHTNIHSFVGVGSTTDPCGGNCRHLFFIMSSFHSKLLAIVTLFLCAFTRLPTVIYIIFQAQHGTDVKPYKTK